MGAMEELGVINLSERFVSRFAFEPDLLSENDSAENNLISALRDSILYWQELNIAPKDPLYIVSTKQGVHIEIPGKFLQELSARDNAQIEEIIMALFEHNKPKLEIMRKYQ